MGFREWFQQLSELLARGRGPGGQWAKAEGHFQTALRLADEMPFKSEQHEVRRFYAGMLIERNGPGDHEKARQFLSEATAGYREIGMPHHEALTETLRKQLADKS
jgi:hypothetical protein